MDLRNRIGLYGSYFLCMAGIGFILPYLPLYLRERGLSDSAIGLVWTFAALAGLVQFPLGVWSDRLRARKPILLAALALLALVTFSLREAHGVLWLGFLAVIFAENGPCRATVESLAGAEAIHLSPPSQVGTTLGALRFWRPVGIIAVALIGRELVEHTGDPGSILLPLAIVQGLAVVAALLIHDNKGQAESGRPLESLLAGDDAPTPIANAHPWRDGRLWAFVVAMVLFHAAAAPGGAYLGLFVKEELGANSSFLPYIFIVMMIAWMLLVRPLGRLADRMGRKPLLVLGWSAMTIRLALIAVAQSPVQILFIQLLDGLAQGMFGVLAAAWVMDRFADPRRAGEAQVLVGSCLVFGSAVGPLLAGLFVEALGYRAMFGLLSATAGVATLIVLILVPETLTAIDNRQPAVSPRQEPIVDSQV
jgi:MFS family permease